MRHISMIIYIVSNPHFFPSEENVVHLSWIILLSGIISYEISFYVCLKLLDVSLKWILLSVMFSFKFVVCSNSNGFSSLLEELRIWCSPSHQKRLAYCWLCIVLIFHKWMYILSDSCLKYLGHHKCPSEGASRINMTRTMLECLALSRNNEVMFLFLMVKSKWSPSKHSSNVQGDFRLHSHMQMTGNWIRMWIVNPMLSHDS